MIFATLKVNKAYSPIMEVYFLEGCIFVQIKMNYYLYDF